MSTRLLGSELFTSSQDNISLEEGARKKTTRLSYLIQRFREWSQKPNQTPNGRQLLARIVWAITSIGIAISLVRFINDTTYELCLTRVEGRANNVENFEDFYGTLRSLDLSPETQVIVDNLILRMRIRTPILDREDC